MYLLFFFSWLCLCLDTTLSAIQSRSCRFGPDEVIHGPDIQFGFHPPAKLTWLSGGVTLAR